MQGQFNKQVEEIYCCALETESLEQREIYLNHACRKDAKLRAVVDKLLALQPDVERFFKDIELHPLDTSSLEQLAAQAQKNIEAKPGQTLE